MVQRLTVLLDEYEAKIEAKMVKCFTKLLIEHAAKTEATKEKMLKSFTTLLDQRLTPLTYTLDLMRTPPSAGGPCAG